MYPPCHVEYLWLDHNQNFRSKTKVFGSHNPTKDGLPMWNYDGSSTKQANGTDSEVFLRPVKLCYDPFRRTENAFLVLFDTQYHNFSNEMSLDFLKIVLLHDKYHLDYYLHN